MCHYYSELDSIVFYCSNTFAPLLLRKCARRRNYKQYDEGVGMHDYSHPHPGKCPGSDERNNKFRPVGVQLGGDAKAVETSDLTGLLTGELEACEP